MLVCTTYEGDAEENFNLNCKPDFVSVMNKFLHPCHYLLLFTGFVVLFSPIIFYEVATFLYFCQGKPVLLSLVLLMTSVQLVKNRK